MIRLRAHHLLCMLTYVGKGYSEAFTANFDEIVARLGHGEMIRIVTGPDDVCTPLLCEVDCHCWRAGVDERDERALGAVSRLLDRHVQPGTEFVLNGNLLARMRTAFRKGLTREACAECEWATLCSTIAESDFAKARLASVA